MVEQRSLFNLLFDAFVAVVTGQTVRYGKSGAHHVPNSGYSVFR